MNDSKFQHYLSGTGSIPKRHLAWPLYGAGLGSLGRDGKPVERPVLSYGPDELLIRHDALSLCYTDVKEIKMGPEHPRLVGRDLSRDPIVPGHEVSMTVMGVGANMMDMYRVGDRVVIQPDVWYQGKSVPYSFGLDGAYRQYGVLGKEVLRGDAGNYLIAVPEGMSYAAAALTEPWACVEASYCMVYRTELQNGGSLWILGSDSSRSGYTLESIWGQGHQPARVVASDVPPDLLAKLRALCAESGVQLTETDRADVLASDESFADILVLDGDAEDIDLAAQHLAKRGVLAIARPNPMSAPIHMDVGRIHYDHIVYVGTSGLNLDKAYQATPVRCALKSQGTAWILGSGGPMGRMHLQRAIEGTPGPRRIIATNRGLARLDHLRASFSGMAKERGVELITASPREEKALYSGEMQRIVAEGGVDDVEIQAASAKAVSEVGEFMAHGGVVNLFAGLKRGTMALVDAWLIYGPRQVRYIGHSGSGLDDQIAMVEQSGAGQLAPERSMAAVGGLLQIPAGIKAMIEGTFPGKIVIYPLVLDFPLTALEDLKDKLPAVYEKLAEGRFWTAEAEAAFLDAMLAE